MYERGRSIETYSAGAGRDVASMVDNEHLKCTAALPLYITSERWRKSSPTIFAQSNLWNAVFICLQVKKKMTFFSIDS